MDAPTKQRLRQIAQAQRDLSIGLAILAAACVLVGVILSYGGPDMGFVARAIAVLTNLFLAATIYQLSRALGHGRGLRITILVAVVFIPFACIIVPLILLPKARRALRDEAIEAGFFKVRRADMQWLQMDEGPRMTCPHCNYDLAGINEKAPCPECGKARA